MSSIKLCSALYVSRFISVLLNLYFIDKYFEDQLINLYSMFVIELEGLYTLLLFFINFSFLISSFILKHLIENKFVYQRKMLITLFLFILFHQLTSERFNHSPEQSCICIIILIYVM